MFELILFQGQRGFEMDNPAAVFVLMDDKNVRILKLPLKYFVRNIFGGRIQVVFQNVKCSFVFR